MSTADDSLYWACFHGFKHRIVELANQNNVNYVRPRFGDTPLHQACKQGWVDIVEMLIEKYGCDPNTVVTENKLSLLHFACVYGHIDVVILLIEKYGCDPNVVTENNESLLHCACLYDYIDIVMLLIEKYSCDPNVVTKSNESLLHYACLYGHTDIVMLLIEKYGCDPNAVTESDESLLHYACQRGHIDIVALLIEECSCDPKVRTRSNQTLLHYACHCGNVDIIEYLINKQHLNPLMRDSINQSEPLDYAVNNNKPSIALYLCQHCISSDELLSPNRIKTTVNLIKFIILRADRWVYDSIEDRIWTTANGDNILQLVGSSKMHIAHVPSAVMSNCHNASCIIGYFKPDLRTADGDTILQLVCQSETLSQISSVVMIKLLSNSTDLMKIGTLKGITADGDNLLEIICQSEKCLIQISSTVFLNWLTNTVLHSMTIAIPDCKTADGDTLLQLVLRTEMSISRISSQVLAKLLSNSRKISINEMKNVNPKWKTVDGAHFPHVVCLSNVESNKVIELMKYYIGENGWNPDTSDSEGNTVLHIACQTDKLALVSHLINQTKCNPNAENSEESLPVDMTTNLEVINYVYRHNRVSLRSKTITKWLSNPVIDDTTMLYILHSLVDNHRTITEDGSTLLHVVCTCSTQRDKQRLIDYQLTECQCDPNCLDSQRRMPLQLTSDFRIMKTLVEHGAQMTTDIVFNLISKHTDFSVCELFEVSTRKGTTLQNPNDLNTDGYAALHLACKADSFTIVSYLLSVAHCDPNVKSRNEEVPIQLTSDLRILRILIEHGAQMTIDVVFELISKWLHKGSRISELFKLSTSKGTMLRNPNDLNSDGYTALHLACKADSCVIVNYLLSVAHCDPNMNSSSEEVPLQMTTNPEIIKDLIRHGAKTSIMYRSYRKALGTNKPLQPPVKIFVVGNPSVGKSTLTAALKTEKWIIAQFFSSGKVSEVDEKTVGIVPHDFESGYFGRVTLYDFAGHREFYSGHVALLQTAIQSTPPIFLLVVKLSKGDNEILKNILYWISFLENQCASVTCRPHIILVGSHADILKGVNPNDKVKTIISTLDKKYFTNIEYIGFVAMNCQFHESTGMSDLRRLLIRSCQQLRIREPITFNAHCFLVYLIDKFINCTAVKIKTISETIKNQQSKEGVLEFLPTNFDALYKICLELNDRSHILLLKDRMAIENSLIIINKEFLLSRVPGAVFAPKGFKEYNELSTNTGVVPLSKITSWLSEVDKIHKKDIIAFLTHLEFCREISDQALHQLISEQYPQVADEHYYLFPGLISLKADDSVWQMQSTMYDCNFGWILKCIHQEQFFSSRFLQVLLLRLAFSFALEASCNKASQSTNPGIHRNCHLWKNGVFWGSVFGMQTLVEVTSDNKFVIVLARFRRTNLLQCIHLRSAVITTILQCKEQFCPRVIVTESFIDSSSPMQYPLNPADTINHTCSLQVLTTAIIRADCRHPDIVFPFCTVPAEIILSFEPYLEMNLPTIQVLCDEKNENKVIENNFFAKFIQKATDELTYLIKAVSESSTSDTSENQLYQDLLRWRDGDYKTNKKTYKDFRQAMDQYSVFAGRNVLVSSYY